MLRCMERLVGLCYKLFQMHLKINSEFMKFLCWNLLVLKDTRTTVKSDYVISLNQNRLRNAVYLCINLSNISYESPHIYRSTGTRRR